MTDVRKAIFLITPDCSLAEYLFEELRRRRLAFHFPAAPDLARARERFFPETPAAVLLDEEASSGRPLGAVVRDLAATVPVVVLAGPARQQEIAPLVVERRVDFVLRLGSFLPLVVGLLERSLGEPVESERAGGYSAEEFSEILRHEINNPLTGILGNAELLLARRDSLLPVEIRRLETITDLAVRLRETVRKLTEAGRLDAQALRPAYSHRSGHPVS